MTYVATYVDVQTDHKERAIELLRQYARASRAESGNSSIDVVQEIFRPNRFVVIEAWSDESSFQTHEGAGHTLQFRSDLKAIHNSPYDQRVHQTFSVGSKAGDSATDAFFVVTHVDVPPPRREETEILLRRLGDESRRDNGAIRYDIFQQNAPRTNHFTVFAIWTGEKAFASHELQPHTRQFREALGPMLGAPYDERFYRRLKD